MMYTTVATLTNLGQYDLGGELKFGSDGLLCGGAPHGGDFGQGGLYKASIDGAVTFISFDGTNGASPGLPVQAPDGKFYGVASFGGSMGAGTVYCLETNGNPKAIYSFDMTNGGVPSGFVIRTNGEFYGSTIFGGIGYDGTPYSGAGVVFKMTTNGQFTLVARLTDTNAFPVGLLEGSDGNFYVMTSRGGAYQYGTICRVTPDGQISTVVTFDGTNGEYPKGIILASDGAFYGCTGSGGIGFNGLNPGPGTVFRLSTNGDFTVLHEFNSTDGWEPVGLLLEVSNGVFYGVTYAGGRNSAGTIFQIASNGDFSVLLNFDSTWSKDSLPIIGLAKGPDGNCYGVTSMPRREIYCLRPVEAPVLQYKFQSDHITLSWNGWGGLRYWLSYRTNLDEPVWHDPVWHDVGRMLTGAETNGILSYTEPIDPAAPRFYKVEIYISEHWW